MSDTQTERRVPIIVAVERDDMEDVALRIPQAIHIDWHDEEDHCIPLLPVSGQIEIDVTVWAASGLQSLSRIIYDADVHTSIRWGRVSRDVRVRLGLASELPAIRREAGRQFARCEYDVTDC